MPDELTHQIYGLIEHAELCQQAAAESQKALDAGALSLETATAGLDERIKKAVEDAVKEKLKNTPAELGQAVADALKKPMEALGTASGDVSKVTGTLKWKVAIGVAFIAFAAMLAPVAFWAIFVPSNAEIQQLRAERDQLQNETNRLQAVKDVTMCGPKANIPCAHVDLNSMWGGTSGTTFYALKP